MILGVRQKDVVGWLWKRQRQLSRRPIWYWGSSSADREFILLFCWTGPTCSVFVTSAVCNFWCFLLPNLRSATCCCFLEDAPRRFAYCCYLKATSLGGTGQWLKESSGGPSQSIPQCCGGIGFFHEGIVLEGILDNALHHEEFFMVKSVSRMP